MANITVQNAKDDLAGKLHGTNVNNIAQINRILATAGRITLTKTDPAETLRRIELTIYDGVTEYAAPSDLKDRKVVDIADQTHRGAHNNPRNIVGNDFDRNLLEDTFRVITRNRAKTLLLKRSLTPARVVFAHMNGSEGWAADGVGLTNLAVDRQIYAEAGESLSFNKADGQTTGYIQTTTISPIDLTNYQNIAAGFVRIWLPTDAAAAALSQLTLRWGSSTTDYYEASATTPHNRSAFAKGWNLVRFDWPSTDTGTPDITGIDYSRLTLTTTSTAINAIRVDDLFFSIGRIVDFDYYSNCPFYDDTDGWVTVITDNDTLLNFDTTSYDIYLNEALKLCAQQIQGENSAADIKAAHEALHGSGDDAGLYANYEEGNPNEAIPPRNTWY